MSSWHFCDDEDEQGYDADKEPSFSFYEFKGWLSKQKKDRPVPESFNSEELKKKFKEKMCKRAEENIEKKLRKKRKST